MTIVSAMRPAARRENSRDAATAIGPSAGFCVDWWQA
jgi:hypothetical protein